MSIPVKGADNATYQVAQASLGEVDKAAGIGVTLTANGNHAKTADITALSNALTAPLGTSGTAPPTIAGTGILGFLRAIYERLTGTLTVAGTVNISDGSGPVTVDGTVYVSNLPDTQPVSATALPLPAGAATSALQTTGNTALASLDGKLPSVGQKTAAQSVPVVLSSDGPFAANFGLTADAAATSDTGAFSFISLFKRALGYLGTLAGTVSAGKVQIAVSTGAALPTVGPTATLAGPTIACPAGQSQQIAFAGDRLFSIINSGVGNVNLGFGTAAVVDTGFPLDAAPGVGRIGGNLVWEAGLVTSVDIFAISAGGSSVVVLKG